MAYNINLSNNELLVTIEDGTTENNFTSLTLIGQNFPGYGEFLNENFVRLLENFSNSASPNNPLKGQLWYDSISISLKFWNASSWISLAAASTSSTVALSTKAINLSNGTGGQIPYQSAANTTSFFGPGTVGQILTSGGTGASPIFTSTIQVTSLGVGTAASGVSGTIRTTGDITAYYSDDRLKNRGSNIENALDKVSSLNGFHYTANDLAHSLGYEVKPEVGVSAQEVQNILPEIVVPAPIDSQYLTVHYERLIPLLIEAIKELKNEVDILKKA